MKSEDLELYIHIPFCVKKCRYCDFLSFPAEGPAKRAYVDMLLREIRQWRGREKRKVATVFFGGGTPSILPGEWLEEIFSAVKETFSLEETAEITVECNPGTLTEELLGIYRGMGVNRLSIGLQSANNDELRLLGRIHTWELFEESFQKARKAGFDNLNIDLISALPGQTVESWQNTLKKVLALSPEHISAYSLIIEEGTPFYAAYGEDAGRRESGEEPLYLPSEEAERQMYEDTEQLLEKAGYQRYEISNYAKPGYACRHNIGYWKRVDYLGFGLGASSLYCGERFKNTESMRRYLDGDFPKEEVQRLAVQEEMEETMFLGLRLTRGVSLEEFRLRFGISCEEVYGPVLEKLEGQGLLRIRDGYAALTAKGMDVSNYCMAEFLLEEGTV